MVKGLNIFKKHFANFQEKYGLIGGTACMLALEEAGIPFRATKDLDIVLCVEVLNQEFVSAFKKFVDQGSYQNRQQSTGKEIFYRFSSPQNKDFPAMLELFSRLPETVKLDMGEHLTPIPLNESMISLSAILLDDDYYHFIHAGKFEINGLPTIGASHLIPLKAKAWLELTAKRLANEATVNEKEIKKHKNDILRLHQLLSINENINLPLSIKHDLREFLQRIEKDSIDLKTLELKNTTYEKVLSNLKAIYHIIPLPSLGEALTMQRGNELVQTVTEILATGANVNDASLNGHRPLQLLIRANLEPHQKLKLVKSIIVLGADIHSTDNSGLTPYQVAVAEGHKAISDLFRSKSVRPMSPPGTGYAQHYNMYGEIPLP
jgi:hypothetical protein